MRGIAWTFIAMAVCLTMGSSAAAQIPPTPEKNIDIQEFYVRSDNLRAGEHPNVNIHMRFCNDGIAVTGATNTSPIELTLAQPHGLSGPSQVRVVGVMGNIGANQNFFAASPHPTDPNKLILGGSTGTGEYAGGGEAFLSTDAFGCDGQSFEAFLKDFILKLPPGFLGNPNSVPVCPTHLWLADSCPVSTQLGHAVADVRPNTAGFSPMIQVPTSIFNLQTMGLEPARLGTDVVPAGPPGPLVNTISVRTDGDYGIDSSQVNLPKDLGGNVGIVRAIDIQLCARVPCQEQDRFNPQTVQPLPGAKPFFVNPTSCKPARVVLEARSWAVDPITDVADTTFTPSNCEDVPFDPAVTVTPAEQSAGASDRQTIAIDYPPYKDATPWQANLRDADVTLPVGMGLAPGGGVDLEACTFEQFGVHPITAQQDNDPAQCPEGSHVGDISVVSPVLTTPIEGKAFFGPTDETEAGKPESPGRPTPENPWKLFLLLEGHGLRIKLVGDVSVSQSGQIRTTFVRQPEVPFEKFELKMGDEQSPGGRNRAVLMTPLSCAEQKGRAELTGWNIEGNPQPQTAKHVTEPAITPTCGPGGLPFQMNVDEASATPEQAGSHSVSKIVISRPDGHQMLKSLKLSLPAGAVGSLSAVPMCPIAVARAGGCGTESKIGNVKTTVGSNASLLSVSGSLYLAEPAVRGDAAAIVLAVPAKVGPIDLGEVVVVNRVLLRDSDSGVDVLSEDIPAVFEGTTLPLRRIEITVDRPGFFLNPTGCDPRVLSARFTSYDGAESSSSRTLNATGCDTVPFGPSIRLIAGAAGQTDQFDHPPFKAIVTQNAGEGAISSARVVLPLILRPNVPFFNEPGALCTDAQAAARACPAKSLAGNARVVTPVLPYQLSGPVHIVQEVGSVLPKIYVFLRGPTGLEVVLKARNSFLGGRRIINTFDVVPDVPQFYFELNINGGKTGILNNFEDLCQASKSDRKFDATFRGHNGKTRTFQPHLRIEGCEESDLRAASLLGGAVKVSKKGVGKVKIRCKRKKACNGRLTVKGKGVTGVGKVKIRGKKTKSVKLKFSRAEVKKIRKARRLGTNAVLKIGDATAAKGRITLVRAKR